MEQQDRAKRSQRGDSASSLTPSLPSDPRASLCPSYRGCAAGPGTGHGLNCPEHGTRAMPHACTVMPQDGIAVILQRPNSNSSKMIFKNNFSFLKFKFEQGSLDHLHPPADSGTENRGVERRWRGDMKRCIHLAVLMPRSFSTTLSSCLAGPQLPRSVPSAQGSVEGSVMGRKALVPSKVTPRPRPGPRGIRTGNHITGCSLLAHEHKAGETLFAFI